MAWAWRSVRRSRAVTASWGGRDWGTAAAAAPGGGAGARLRGGPAQRHGDRAVPVRQHHLVGAAIEERCPFEGREERRLDRRRGLIARHLRGGESADADVVAIRAVRPAEAVAPREPTDAGQPEDDFEAYIFRLRNHGVAVRIGRDIPRPEQRIAGRGIEDEERRTLGSEDGQRL